MEVPVNYISDAMGHSLGNKGNITRRYISPFSLDKRIKYNSLLINTDNKGADADSDKEKEDIISQFSDFSAEELKMAMNIMKSLSSGKK